MRKPVRAAAILLLLAATVAPTAASAQDASPSTIDVTGVEYAFVGMPSSVPVGTSIRFVNGGAEDHEMFFARRNEGTTESIEELMQLPPDQLGPKLTIAGGLFANVGQTSITSMTLDEEGDYIAICFIPQGTANGVPPDDPENALPHAALGMTVEFTVGGPDTSLGPDSTPVPMEDGSAEPSPGA